MTMSESDHTSFDSDDNADTWSLSSETGSEPTLSRTSSIPRDNKEEEEEESVVKSGNGMCYLAIVFIILSLLGAAVYQGFNFEAGKTISPRS